MCGIAGIVKPEASKSYLDMTIKNMTDVISHRGPDGYGYFFAESLALGHRRLAILDLSSEGSQPMHYMDRYVITYNGEIYNYIELKSELESLGCNFFSNTDTEVILAAYDVWGEKCVERFNGMWAFAILDKDKRKIFCSRDRFGVKPFYYTTDGNFFAFGSEIKQLLDFLPRRIANHRVLLDFLIIGLSEHTSQTFFEGIECLPSGSNLSYCLVKNSFEISRWYELAYKTETDFDSCDITLKKFNATFTDSVALRLRSDVTIGSCLSGGLDSSSIIGVASKLLGDDHKVAFRAIHSNVSNASQNESYYAQLVADHLDIKLNIIEPSIEDLLHNLDEIVYTQEEPFLSASICMQYFVMKKAREIGCTVMLDGQGGDETLLGYERYFPAFLLSTNFLDSLRECFYLVKNSKLSVFELLIYLLYFPIEPVRRFYLKRRFHFLKKECFSNMKWIKKIAKTYLSIYELQKIEILHTQLPHLLRYEDKNSMRNSVEARLPFMDYRLLEHSVSMSPNLKINKGWTKHALRLCLDSILPKNVTRRKDKLGFEAPQTIWVSAIKSKMIADIETSKLISSLCKSGTDFSKIDSNLLWRLYSIAKWEKCFDIR